MYSLERDTVFWYNGHICNLEIRDAVYVELRVDNPLISSFMAQVLLGLRAVDGWPMEMYERQLHAPSGISSALVGSNLTPTNVTSRLTDASIALSVSELRRYRAHGPGCPCAPPSGWQMVRQSD